MKFSVKCPNCGKNLKLDSSKHKSGNIIKCPNCGVNIELTGDGLKKLSDIDKILDSIPKEIKIKF